MDISIGTWGRNMEDNDIEIVRFNGRFLADAVVSHGYEISENDKRLDWDIFHDTGQTIWEIYMTQDGFALYWEEYVYGHETYKVSDYVKLNEMPKAGEEYHGVRFASEPVPAKLIREAQKRLIDDAKAVLLAQDEEE